MTPIPTHRVVDDLFRDRLVLVLDACRSDASRDQVRLRARGSRNATAKDVSRARAPTPSRLQKCNDRCR